MNPKFIYTIFFCLLASICFGQSELIDNLIDNIENQPVEIVDTLDRVYDSRDLTVRKLDQDLQEEYAGGDFNYERVVGSSENLFGRFMSWMIQGLQDIFGFKVSPLTVKILTYLFYFLIGGAVVYMIVRLVTNESASKLFGKQPKKSGQVHLEDTHIEEINFTELISNSEREGNYRNAIRYQYLSLLKNLSKRDLIDWDFQKTNTDYYRELKDSMIREHFKKVSYLYDHVWYGAFPIDEPTYHEAVNEFKILKNRAA